MNVDIYPMSTANDDSEPTVWIATYGPSLGGAPHSPLTEREIRELIAAVRAAQVQDAAVVASCAVELIAAVRAAQVQDAAVVASCAVTPPNDGRGFRYL